MNEMQVFSNPEFGRVRGVLKNGESWWVLKDLCKALGIENPRNVAARLDDDEKGVHLMDTPGGQQELRVVNESGLYNVVLRSEKPHAKAFKRWITHEVLPTIRKTGGYSTQPIDVVKVVQMTAEAMMSEFVRQIIPLFAEGAAKEQDPQISTADFEFCDATCCKMESFPAAVRQQVDSMLEVMAQGQQLNYSKIARFCTMQGYPITSPSVKTYFNRRFS